MRRIAAHYIFLDGEIFPRPVVTLSDEGVITDIEVAADDIDRRPLTEFYDGVLLPDLVNAHCHSELSHLAGQIAEGGGFTAFAQAMGTVRRGFSAEERAEAWSAADRAMWEQGIGAVGDVCNGTTTFAAKSQSPIAYTNFVELFGLGSADADVARKVAAEGVAAGLRCGITPHSTYSLSVAAFADAVAASSPEVPLSVHFMESPDEAQLYRGEGAMAELYAQTDRRIDFAHFGSPAERIVGQVPADRDILLIHNCFVGAEEVERIESHFRGRVTWVVCPRSNHYISRTVPPVGLLMRKGVRVAIGTDSLASNTALSMVREMAALDAPIERVLAWATTGGAEALGIEEQMGRLAVGRRSGIVALAGLGRDLEITEGSVLRRIC